MNASALMGMRRAMLILAAMLALLMLVGCGGGWGDLRPTVAIAQGSSQTVVVGQPVTFTAVTTGTGPFTYQWYLNGKSVSGATASTYAISETTSAMNGSVYTVTATNAAGTASSQGCTLTVNTPPAITNPPSNQTVYVGQAGSFSVTATGTSPLSYQWYLNGSAISGATSSSYTTPATTTIGDSSSYTVKVTNSAGSATSSAATLTVLPLVPTLAFAPIPVETYGNPPFTVSASSASSGAITYSLVSGPATVSNTGTVVITGTGSVFISASQAASGNYTTATATTSFVVDAEAQTINFANPGIQTVASPLTLSATSTSGLPVTLSSSTPSVCTVSGATVALIASGICTIDANQAGNTDYAPATMVPQSFTVNGEAQTITFANPGAQTVATPLTLSATSTSGLTVTFTSTTPSVCTVSGTTATFLSAGTCTIDANQAGNSTYAAAPMVPQSFTVNGEAQTITFANPGTQTVATPLTLSATSTSGLTVTFTSTTRSVCTVSGTTATFLISGTCTIDANQAGNSVYSPAPTVAQSFSVSNTVPIASSLSGSSATPPYNASINLIPTFSGGTGMIGTTGVGSSDITASATSGNSYPTPGVTAQTIYTLTVTGSGGNTASATFTATPTSVSITPITPANQTSAPATVDFSATASGGATDNLTWSATGGTISSTGVWIAPDTPGTYTIKATSADDPAVSVTTTIVISLPVITTQPISENVCAGASPSFTIAASYASSYQWYKGASEVSTGNTLTFNDVTSASNGSYTCTVTNAAGTVTSNVAVLNVLTPAAPAITSNPASVSVYASQTATFSVSATGTGTLTYQWYTGAPPNGTAIAGATSSTYTTGSLTDADNGTEYYATVTDTACTNTTLTSTAATLTVTDTDTALPPTIIIQPTAQSTAVDGTATFSVTATGGGPSPHELTYQWYWVPYSSTMANSAGTAISGATSSTYTVPSSDTAQSNDGDNYYVIVSNGYGTALSVRAMLTVGQGISMNISGQPTTEYIPVDTLASFSVTATCTGCIPAYQWYWYAPGATTAIAVTDGAVSSGALNGAAISGSTTSSVTLQNVPSTASGGIFYVVVTSTSDGSTQIPGTNPLTSNTAGLFVGSPGSIGDPTPGSGLCNSATNWVLNGTNPGTVSGDVPYQNTTACTIELTNNLGNERASIYWPTLISTANFTVSFTVAMSSGATPADGFTMILADPSQGATTSSIGTLGEGLGVAGIPGFVVGWDTYQNGNDNGGALENNCSANTLNGACDPITVPYMAVGSGAPKLWENPWTYVNGNLDTQFSKDYSAQTFANATHSYVISVASGVITVTMDGYQLFTGPVALPPVAYLGFTASTGGKEEAVTFSNLTATVGAPQ
ncbi:MAG: immunoglobulin domain-containing protein [Terriglobales bacterium]